ncbi:hypothetical protein PR048_008841 [Dryococelus australis]|uniref:Uncharacterized protein n=1 Tax=Dryococelus australis TaxID=614101 RepID=A0ABQ9HYL7_9NEOP|nr:hypothetical protein PR048_008841 [Dryococelus australis]
MLLEGTNSNTDMKQQDKEKTPLEIRVKIYYFTKPITHYKNGGEINQPPNNFTHQDIQNYVILNRHSIFDIIHNILTFQIPKSYIHCSSDNLEHLLSLSDIFTAHLTKHKLTASSVAVSDAESGKLKKIKHQRPNSTSSSRNHDVPSDNNDDSTISTSTQLQSGTPAGVGQTDEGLQDSYDHNINQTITSNHFTRSIFVIHSTFPLSN